MSSRTSVPPIPTATIRPLRAVANSSPARLASHLWAEARPVVQVVFQLRFLTGAVFATAAGGRLGGGTLLAEAGWLGVVFAVYVLNGVSDLAGDRANGSARPLAAGLVGVRTATAVTAAAGAGGLVACWLANPACGALAALMLVLGAWYSVGSRPAKNSPAAAALVCTVGGLLTFAAGARAADGGLLPAEWAVVALLSVWMGIAGSTKDFDDVVGDTLAGRRTLPVRLGDRRARAVVAAGVLALSVAAAVTAVHYAGSVPAGAATATVLAVGGPVVASRTVRPCGRRDAYRLFMLTQWCAVLTALTVTALS